MIQTIHIALLLRETVRAPYRNLLTRPTGAAVRSWIQKAIALSDAPTTMLDFTEVGLLDFSCADEIVAKLLLDTDPGTDRYVMLLGTREDPRLLPLPPGCAVTDGSAPWVCLDTETNRRITEDPNRNADLAIVVLSK